MKLEAHITLLKEDAEKLKEFAEKTLFAWKFSQIDGDPLLGAKPFCYLTKHASAPMELFNEMKYLSDDLTHRGFHVVRTKLERIIFDSKTDFFDVGGL